jgi:hypothetical protein
MKEEKLFIIVILNIMVVESGILVHEPENLPG